jgi:hypothetical protein
MILNHANELIDNEMDIYAAVQHPPINEDKYNLLTLRADLHLSFARSAFVFVPKSGQLRVHFLKCVAESGILYHDTLFNDHNRLGRAFVLARFGWAVIQLAKHYVQHPELFDFTEDEQNMDDNKRDDGDGDGHQHEPEDEGQEPARKKRKRPETRSMPTRRSSRKTKEGHNLQPEEIHGILLVAWVR